MTRAGSAAMVTLGVGLMHMAVAFASPFAVRHEPLSLVAPLLMLAFGAVVVGVILGEVSGDAYGRIGGIESMRSKVGWIVIAFASVAIHILPMAADQRHPARPWVLELAMALALVPVVYVPVALVDPRVSFRHAIALSYARILRTPLVEVVRGPVSVVATLPLAVTATMYAARALEHAGCLAVFATYAAIVGTGAALTLAGVAHVARDARRGPALGDRRDPFAMFTLAAPTLLALAMIGTLVVQERITRLVPRPLLVALGTIASMAVGLGVGAAVTWLLRRRLGPAALGAPLRVTLRAADVETDDDGYRLRRGAELTRDDGKRIPASGLAIEGFALETPPDAIVEAWVEAPPRGADTYRTAPSTLREDAVVCIGSPSASVEAHAMRELAGVVPLLAAATPACVIAAGLFFDAYPRALELVVRVWRGG